MSTKLEKYASFVKHPRYGREPRITGYNPKDDYGGKTFLHWHSSEDCRIPDTAIKADISKQTSATIPVTDYYDVTRKCVDCENWFIFFAEEQKFWYEVLHFILDADCIRCINCRKKDRKFRLMQKDYGKLITQKHRTKKETKHLKNIALELYQLGYIRDINKVNKIG